MSGAVEFPGTVAQVPTSTGYTYTYNTPTQTGPQWDHWESTWNPATAFARFKGSVEEGTVAGAVGGAVASGITGGAAIAFATIAGAVGGFVGGVVAGSAHEYNDIIQGNKNGTYTWVYVSHRDNPNLPPSLKPLHTTNESDGLWHHFQLLNGAQVGYNPATHKMSYTGGANDDNMIGTNSSDRVSGGKGNDTLKGKDGSDALAGGDGNDTIKGDDGSDNLSGNAGNDKIYGGDGADKIYITSGKDIADGGADGDTFYFGSGVTGARVNNFDPSLHLITLGAKDYYDWTSGLGQVTGFTESRSDGYTHLATVTTTNAVLDFKGDGFGFDEDHFTLSQVRGMVAHFEHDGVLG